MISSPIEHPAIAEPVARLEAAGFAVDHVPVDAKGLADVSQMAATISRRHAVRHLDAGQQRDWRDPAGRRTGGAGGTRRASRSIPMLCRPSAASRSIFTSWVWRRWRPARTNFTAQWGSVYFWCGAASGSARGFSAVASSKAGGRGPSRSLLSVGLAAALPKWQDQFPGPGCTLDRLA